MNPIQAAVEFILHIDEKLIFITQTYGTLAYAILFAIIFIETGLVIMPFLPGDSLLFAAGTLAAIGSFNIVYLILLCITAAFLGDTTNYWIGHFLGQEMTRRFPKIVKPEYLAKAQAFYEKHGGMAIVLARFVPIVRTFAPFVAGVGKMTYPHFLAYNIIGGVIWVSLFTLLGFFFGNLPFVQQHFELAVVAIILISLLPMVVESIKARREKTGDNQLK